MKNFEIGPAKLIEQLRAWFHAKDRSVLLATDTFLNFNAAKRLVLANDAVTKTQSWQSVDTQGMTSSDDLDTISGARDGDLLLIRQHHDSRNVTITDDDNIVLPSGPDLPLDQDSDAAGFVYDASLGKWLNFANPFGRMALIWESTLGGSVASVTTPTLPGTFRSLLVSINARTDRALTLDGIYWQANADAGANYDSVYVAGQNAVVSSSNGIASTSGWLLHCDAANSRASCFSSGYAWFPNYKNTNQEKQAIGIGGNVGTPTAATIVWSSWNSHWRNTAAITSITFLPAVGPNFVANSVFQVWGVL